MGRVWQEPLAKVALAVFSGIRIFQLNFINKNHPTEGGMGHGPYLASLQTSILQNSGSERVPSSAWPRRMSLFHALLPTGW